MKIFKSVLLFVFLFMVTGNSVSVLANDISPSPSNVYVDGKKVVYPVNPVLKNGTVLVPLRETFEALGATVTWIPEEKKVIAKNGNREVVLVIDSNVAYVDGQSIPLTTPSLIYQSKTMIPLRFVGEAFGGTVDFNSSTKSINITMPKFITEFLPTESAILTNIINVEGAKMTGNRRLMVSDNPEVLNEVTIKSSNVTLWNDIVVENVKSKDHRVFAWHINELPDDVVLGITIENRSKVNILEIKNAKGIHKKSQNTWYEHDIGLPIAESLLSNRLQNLTLFTNKVLPGETIQLGHYQMSVNEALGLLNEFTVIQTSDNNGPMNYVIRTVISDVKGYDITKIKDNPVPLDLNNVHSRGIWPSSDLSVTLPLYQVGGVNNVVYNISNGRTDDLFSVDRSLVLPQSSISNKGHFGVIYKVKIPYVNTTKEEKKIQVRIGSRGGQYSGAVKTKTGVYNIPTIEAMKDVAIVLNENVKPCKCSGFIELNIVHSGGASLPIAINVLTIE